MERITEDQIARLVTFVYARISDADSLQEEGARRMVTALRVMADKQVAAVRYYRASPSDGTGAVEVHAIASWNLLVSVAHIWRDHSEFPADAAMETFEFDAEDPLRPAP
ncbi:hypothetical protein ACFS5L_41900 [Streptomyces phyllanthi]|uniref:Uncharacterized protein n=1 Tax=Streptomyces phyllanthi TaxID=1803180 RepID=A0A5N8W844_9ACTN|nr:hypothetical protein [Streptomyces phyllanthi]MPY43640.1 hypothetical protein [Streptomyces phyllanthi]